MLTRDTKGLFEQAHGGTIFLNEIGDISPALQSALLRVVQTGEIQPLDGKPRPVDVRVLAATHAAASRAGSAGTSTTGWPWLS